MTLSARSSKTITYQYNGVGLVSDMAISRESSFTYSHNARNQLDTVTNPNSVQVTFSYDNGGRRTRITDPGSYVEYAYSARNGSAIPLGWATPSQRDWLTDVGNGCVRLQRTAMATPARRQGFSHRTSKTLGGTTITYSYEDNSKLTSASGRGQNASFSYDNNGNMTGVSGTMFGSKTMVYNGIQ